jgi:tetratricopeptide (TPR) repeat protein
MAKGDGKRSEVEEPELPDCAPTPTHELLRAAGEPLAPGDRVSRYLIVASLGAGGMGEVLAAYDPDLDRKVALKLLRSDRYPSAAASRRLLREAQALARLTHPNVVTVHDVGTHAGQVWLAMEFVSGQTLRAWLAQQPRRWTTTLEILCAAGRGLAAAHQRGLLHRDVKPDNVMIADDGRVRVMDFGLARLEGPDTGTELPLTDARASPGSSDAASTSYGALLGTPAYLAPERFLGYEADARSDQFAFCVMAWEALFGERPFTGDSPETLEHAITEGRRRPAPRGARVPTWLRRVCARGLEPDPGARWPSMDALLDALAGGRARIRRRRAGFGVGLTGLVFAGLAAWQGAEDAATRRDCAGLGATIEQTWNPEARATLEQALRATNSPNAEATVARVLPRVDAWAEQWAALRERTCVEARLEESLPPTLAAASRQCLADQRDTLAGILATLSEGGDPSLERAVPALAGLSPLERCADRRVLERWPRSTADPAQRRALMRLRGRLATGEYEAGLAEAEALLASIEAAETPALVTQVRATLGELARLAGELDRAEVALRRAFLEAGELRDEELAALVALRLAILVGVDGERSTEGLAWADSAEMLLRRLGEDQGPLAGDLEATRAHLQLILGDHDAAERGYAQARALAEANFGPNHTQLAEAINGLSLVHDARGEYEAAEDLSARALAVRERALGPDHPIVAASLLNLGLMRWRRGDLDGAREPIERALAIWTASFGPGSSDVAWALNSLALIDKAEGHYAEAEAGFLEALAIREQTLGPDHRQVADTLNGLAGIERMRGDHERAQRHYERVLQIYFASLGPDHPDVAAACNNLGEVYRARGDDQRASELYERALAIYERTHPADHPLVAASLSNLALVATNAGNYERAQVLNLRALHIRERALGPEHTSVGISLNNLGEVELLTGALDEAEAHYGRALAIFEASLGPTHLHLSYPLHGLAQVALARGQADEARALLERALAVREAGGAAPADRAELRFDLARALRATGARRRARAAAERAREEYVESGRDEAAAAITAWLG